MKRKSAVVVVLGLTLVLGVAAATIPAVRPLSAQGSFTGKLQRIQTSTTPPTWSIRVTGPIQIAGLGVGTAELAYDNVTLAPGGNNLLAGTEQGTGVVTLATGEKLFGTIRWLTSPTADPNVLAIVGTLTVTGGTGAYANVRGSGIAVGRGIVSTNDVIFSLDGFLDGLPGLGPTDRRPGVTR